MNPLWNQKFVVQNISDYDVEIHFSLNRLADNQEKVFLGSGSISLKDLFGAIKDIVYPDKLDSNTESFEMITERDILPKV